MCQNLKVMPQVPLDNRIPNIHIPNVPNCKILMNADRLVLDEQALLVPIRFERPVGAPVDDRVVADVAVRCASDHLVLDELDEVGARHFVRVSDSQRALAYAAADDLVAAGDGFVTAMDHVHGQGVCFAGHGAEDHGPGALDGGGCCGAGSALLWLREGDDS